jgi:acyl carrier protein
MGMDMLEIAISIEERILNGIPLPRESLTRQSTVGEIYDALLEEIENEKGLTEEEKEGVWVQLIDLISEQLCIDKKSISRASRFVDDLGAD